MKNIFKHIVLVIIALAFASCVQSVENPYVGGDGDTNNPTTKPVINVLSPVAGDSIHMGISPIIYQAADYNDGPGLKQYNLFVDGTLVQSFTQNTDGSNPYLFFSTDSLEKKLGIDPYNWPSEISYAVALVNEDGDVGQTTLIDSIFIDRKPVQPKALTLTRNPGSDKSFNLFWDDFASNETKYEVWRQDGNNNLFVLLQTLQPNTISTNDVVTSDYINYGYKVRTINGFGNSKFSNIVYSSGAVGGDAPSNLIGEALGASVVQLSWKDNSNTEDGFIIERTNPATGGFERLAVLPRNTIEYFDNDLYPLTTYKYRVASYKSSSLSAWSNVINVATYGQDIIPPQFLTATFISANNSIKISWQDNTFLEKGTIVERKEAINGKYEVIGITEADDNVFHDFNININQLYYYRARFITTEGFKTQYSNEDTVFVYDAPPNAPTNLQIIQFSSTTYSLWWEDNSDDEEAYEVWRKAGNTGTYVLYKTLLPNTIAFNDTVNLGVVYYYKVRAFRNPVYSQFSNEISTEDGNGGTTPAPSNLSYAIVSGTNVKINWKNNAADELQIIIERKFATEINFSEVKRLAPETTTWTDNSATLTHNMTIFYRIKAKYPQGNSEYSNELTVYIP
jgi:fibronectin type 3 domain-containing protein